MDKLPPESSRPDASELTDDELRAAHDRVTAEHYLGEVPHTYDELLGRRRLEDLPEDTPLGRFYRERVLPIDAAPPDVDPFDALASRMFYRQISGVRKNLRAGHLPYIAVNLATADVASDLRAMFRRPPDQVPLTGFFRDASEACKRQFEETGELDV